MVLPTPPADPPAGSTAWLSRLDRIVGISGERGVIALVTGATPAQLRSLVMALETSAAAWRGVLSVCLRAPDLVDVPEGAVVLLRARAEDAAWLNEYRPLFSARRWRAVLWAEGDAAVALKRRAPDFWDWISHVVECPAAVPAFAVRGIREAPGFPGLVWRGSDVEGALAAAGSTEEVTRLDIESCYGPEGYGRLLAEAEQCRGWLVLTGVRSALDVTRVRWALAESGRPGRVVLERPACPAPGWWPVSDQCLDWQQAADMLAGVEQAPRLAALLDLEPEAVALAAEVATIAAVGEELLARLGAASDPGAEIAREARARGHLDLDDVVRMEAAGPSLRALFRDVEVERRRDQVCADMDRDLALWSLGRHSGVWPAPEELLPWVNSQPALSPGESLGASPYPVRAYVLEAVIRHAARDGAWTAAANLAVEVGHYDIAVRWAETRDVDAGTFAPEQPRAVSTLELLAASLQAQERHYGETEVRLHHAIDAAARVYGPDSPQEAQLRGGLALALFRQGKLDEAETHLRQALTTIETSPDHDDIRVQLTRQLGMCWMERGQYDRAEETLRDAVDMGERVFGADSVDQAISLKHLATVLWLQRRPREARDLAQRAWKIMAGHPRAEHAWLEDLRRMFPDLDDG